jgi:hypothetical protein
MVFMETYCRLDWQYFGGLYGACDNIEKQRIVSQMNSRQNIGEENS